MNSKQAKPLPEVGDVICTHELDGRARPISQLVVEGISRHPHENQSGQKPRPHNSYCITVRKLKGRSYNPRMKKLKIDVVGECDDQDHPSIPRTRMSIVGTMELKAPYTFTPVRPSRSQGM